MNLDQIRARRAAIGIRLAAILALLTAETRTLTPDESNEQITLEAEDTALASTERFHIRMAERATVQTVDPATLEPARVRAVGQQAPAILTHTTQAQRNGDAFKGQSFARFALATAAAHLRKCSVAEVMEERFGRSRPELVKLARLWNRSGLAGVLARRMAADVTGGGTGSGDWGHELVQLDGQFTGDFIDLLRAKTVFDQLPLRVVPANVTIKGQDGTGVAYWVGEHKPIPMSAQDYSAVSLTPLKIGALTAMSIELVEDSTPDAESLATSSLVADSAQLLDAKFFSTDAASAGVSPAGMLNGLSAGTSHGPDLNGLIFDTNALVQTFITAKNTGGLHWASRPGLARNIADFRNLMGQRVYDTVTEEGGTYDGKPFHTSDNVGAGDLVILKPSDIYRIGDSGLSVDVSTEATLEFGSAPTGAGDTPTDASENPVSLFQAGMIGIRVLRRINWAKRRASAVAYIGDAAYVPQIQTA